MFLYRRKCLHRKAAPKPLALRVSLRLTLVLGGMLELGYFVPIKYDLVMLETIKAELRDVYRFRWVVFSYVQTNLKIKYRRSYLGFFWTVLAPMAHYIVIGVMLSLILQTNVKNYFVFYFAGAVFYSLVNGMVGKSPSIMLLNEHFIRKIYVPKIVFVLNVAGLEVVNFLMVASTLLFLGLIFGKIVLSPFIVFSLVSLALLTFFLLGIAMILSVLTVYFRDLIHITSVLLQALFFVTPVTYTEEMIPPQLHWVIYYNPLYYYLEVFRLPLLEGQPPAANSTLLCFVFSVLSLMLGLWIIKKFDNRIIFKL